LKIEHVKALLGWTGIGTSKPMDIVRGPTKEREDSGKKK